MSDKGVQFTGLIVWWQATDHGFTARLDNGLFAHITAGTQSAIDFIKQFKNIFGDCEGMEPEAAFEWAVKLKMIFRFKYYVVHTPDGSYRPSVRFIRATATN